MFVRTNRFVSLEVRLSQFRTSNFIAVVNAVTPVAGLTFDVEMETGWALNPDETNSGNSFSRNKSFAGSLASENYVTAELDVVGISEVVDIGPVDAQALDSVEVFFADFGGGDVHF
jgi:hypothetical protein